MARRPNDSDSDSVPCHSNETAWPVILCSRILAVAAGAAVFAYSAGRPASAASPQRTSEESPVIVQAYGRGLSGVRAANPDVKLSLGRDPELPGEPVLFVDYPQPTDDPAGRDVWCDAEQEDWTVGRAISFQIKPARPVKLSVSFFDRNHVLYTTWIELQGGGWQTVRIAFDEIHPNTYFQPRDAKTGAPIDLSETKGIAFAPHDPTSGHLTIAKFVLTD
jgi:Carbohydrate binding domain (family 11)